MLCYSRIHDPHSIVIRVRRRVVRVSLPLVLDDLHRVPIVLDAVYPPRAIRRHLIPRQTPRQALHRRADRRPRVVLEIRQLHAVVRRVRVHRQHLEAERVAPPAARLVEARREGGDRRLGADVAAERVPDVPPVAVDDLRQPAGGGAVEYVHAAVPVDGVGRRVREREGAVLRRRRQVHLDHAVRAVPPRRRVLEVRLPDSAGRLPVQVRVLVAQVALLAVRDERGAGGRDVVVAGGGVDPVCGR